MSAKPPIKYRDSASQELIVRLLSDQKERQAFLDDRHGYLSMHEIPIGPRNALLKLSDEAIIGTADEFNYNFPSVSTIDANPELAARRPRTGCEKSTFRDIFCDG